LLCTYLCATDAPHSVAGWRERTSGDQASFKSFSPLPCHPAWQERPAITTVAVFRDTELFANGCFELQVARHGAAAEAAGPRSLSPLQPP